MKKRNEYRNRIVTVFLYAAAATLGAVLFGVYLIGRTQQLQESVDEALTYNLPDELGSASDEASLHAPPLAYLSRVAGDPKLLPGESGVRIPVLMYHWIRPILPQYTARDRLYTVTPESFASQMRSLVAAGYHTITPDDLRDAIRAGTTTGMVSKPVLLTFDDGMRGQYLYAFPILKKLGLKATFFLISNERSRGGMSDAMVTDMAQNPLITIAAHTRHHTFLTRLSAAALDAEVRGSKDDLEALTGKPVDYFAYPFGSWNDSIRKQVESMGFDLAFGIRLGSLHAPSSAFQMRRIRVLQGEDVVALLDLFSASSK